MYRKQREITIDAVIFDIGNVLVGYSHQITHKYFAELLGLDLDYVIKTAFTSREAKKIWMKSEIGGLTSREFYLKIIRLLDISWDDLSLEEFEKAMTISGFPNPEIWELIETFTEKNPKIERAIISNNTSLYEKAGLKLMPRLNEFFSPENIFMSHKIGVKKPNPAFFGYACLELGVATENVLLIDDEPKNVERFRRMGGTAIQYNCSKDYIVHLWTELGKLDLL